MKRKLFCLVISITVTFAVEAQNFSGYYTIQSKEMVEGKEYGNAIAKDIRVTQTKDSLKITRETPAGNNRTTISTESLSLNGQAVVTTTSTMRKKIAKVSFSDDSSIVTFTYLLSYAEEPDKVEFKNTEVWTLKNDGILTITKTSDATNSDDWIIKAVFKTN